MKFRKKPVVIEAMQYYAGMPVIHFPAWLMVAKLKGVPKTVIYRKHKSGKHTVYIVLEKENTEGQ